MDVVLEAFPINIDVKEALKNFNGEYFILFSTLQDCNGKKALMQAVTLIADQEDMEDLFVDITSKKNYACDIFTGTILSVEEALKEQVNSLSNLSEEYIDFGVDVKEMFSYLKALEKRTAVTISKRPNMSLNLH